LYQFANRNSLKEELNLGDFTETSNNLEIKIDIKSLVQSFKKMKTHFKQYVGPYLKILQIVKSSNHVNMSQEIAFWLVYETPGLKEHQLV